MSDLAITAANVLPSASATIVRKTAGAAITAGQPVYLDPATDTVKLADANGASPLFKVYGIAGCNAAAGQPICIVMQDPALGMGAAVAAGTTLILSATPGGVAPVADAATGMYVTVLGVGIGSNQINFSPLAAGVATP